MNTRMFQFARLPAAAMFVAMLLAVAAPFAAVQAEEAETATPVELVGQLIELSATEAPTTVVVREDPAGEWTDYTVDITTGTSFGTWIGDTTSMSDWITGDQLHVWGERNDNTGVVTATRVINNSLNPFKERGLNGWITEIDESGSTMKVQWLGLESTVTITDNTHLVVPPTNPAALSDFEIGDRVRLRIIKNSDVENEARIIVALRRGEEIFLLARTRGFRAELNEINDAGDGTGTLEVTLGENAHLRAGDVNNLVGTEGDKVLVNYDENTKFVRRYSGETDTGEFEAGDMLFVVGRVSDEAGDDGETVIDARLVKDENIWRAGVANRLGTVTGIDLARQEIVIGPLHETDSELEVTVSYTDETAFTKDGADASAGDLEEGDVIRVRGTARRYLGETVMEIAAEQVFLYAAMPDLRVVDVYLDGSTVTAEVANLGDADVSTNDFGIAFYFDGELEWNYSASTLTDQDFLQTGEASLIQPEEILEDTAVQVCVDSGYDIDEYNESNNCLTITLDV